MDEISRIQEDEIAYQPIEYQTTRPTEQPTILDNQWGVEKINAPDAWLLFGGINGSGITVANTKYCAIITKMMVTHGTIHTIRLLTTMDMALPWEL